MQNDAARERRAFALLGVEEAEEAYRVASQHAAEVQRMVTAALEEAKRVAASLPVVLPRLRDILNTVPLDELERAQADSARLLTEFAKAKEELKQLNASHQR